MFVGFEGIAVIVGCCMSFLLGLALGMSDNDNDNMGRRL